MPSSNNEPRGELRSSLYIDGYFSDRIVAGESPDYGYPQNHLPETTITTMEVATGFLCALKKKKQ